MVVRGLQCPLLNVLGSTLVKQKTGLAKPLRSSRVFVDGENHIDTAKQSLVQGLFRHQTLTISGRLKAQTGQVQNPKAERIDR